MILVKKRESLFNMLGYGDWVVCGAGTGVPNFVMVALSGRTHFIHFMCKWICYMEIFALKYGKPSMIFPPMQKITL